MDNTCKGLRSRFGHAGVWFNQVRSYAGCFFMCFSIYFPPHFSPFLFIICFISYYFFCCFLFFKRSWEMSSKMFYLVRWAFLVGPMVLSLGCRSMSTPQAQSRYDFTFFIPGTPNFVDWIRFFPIYLGQPFSCVILMHTLLPIR